MSFRPKEGLFQCLQRENLAIGTVLCTIKREWSWYYQYFWWHFLCKRIRRISAKNERSLGTIRCLADCWPWSCKLTYVMNKCIVLMLYFWPCELNLERKIHCILCARTYNKLTDSGKQYKLLSKFKEMLRTFILQFSCMVHFANFCIYTFCNIHKYNFNPSGLYSYLVIAINSQQPALDSKFFSFIPDHDNIGSCVIWAPPLGRLSVDISAKLSKDTRQNDFDRHIDW